MVVTPGIARLAIAVGDHRRLSGVGPGDSGGVSASAAPALLGSQDAESVRGSAPSRARRNEAGWYSGGHQWAVFSGTNQGFEASEPLPV
jgi:hypothetical protein